MLSGSRLVVEVGADLVPPIELVSHGFLAGLAKDPLVFRIRLPDFAIVHSRWVPCRYQDGFATHMTLKLDEVGGLSFIS